MTTNIDPSMHYRRGEYDCVSKNTTLRYEEKGSRVIIPDFYAKMADIFRAMARNISHMLLLWQPLQDLHEVRYIKFLINSPSPTTKNACSSFIQRRGIFGTEENRVG